MADARRVGLFGGTFDPIHVGHMAVAEAAFSQLRLQHLVFIPSGIPPHKRARQQAATAEHRCRMVECAVMGDQRFSVSRIEIERSGTSFTVDSVRALAAALPCNRLYFILGDDCVANLHRWKGLDELLTLVKFVSVPRLGVAADASVAKHIAPIEMPLLNISSTSLRATLAIGEAGAANAANQLAPVVFQYIKRHQLYRQDKEQA